MIDRKFFLGFVRIHILHHANQEHVYGVWLIDELARHGYDISPGTLYPILHGMEKEGFLVRDDRVVQGKVRKYYIMTPKGRDMLRRGKTQVQELLTELEEGPFCFH